MLASIFTRLCLSPALTLIPTAANARTQARMALAQGRYDQAAYAYAKAAQALGNSVQPALFRQTLFPEMVRACAKAAARVQVEEFGRDSFYFRSYPIFGGDLEPLFEGEELGEITFKAAVGFSLSRFEPSRFVSRDERLLLTTHMPVEAAAKYLYDLKIDPFDLYNKKGIALLFAVRMLETTARDGESEAVARLGSGSRYSQTAERALRRLERDNIPGAEDELAALRVYRHDLFKTRERNRLEALRRNADNARAAVMFGFPHG